MNVFNQLSVWLSFQLSIIFLIGIPVSLFFWSIKKRNKAVNKLLSIYWKISLLFFISLLLLIGKYSYALLITNNSTLLMTISVWFWNDINDEFKEYDFSYSLITITKVWRWSLTLISLNFIEISTKWIYMLSHKIINLFLGNNIKMDNIHNYDNSKIKSNNLMFNDYVYKKKKF